ncbi:MAG: hypothetical protein GXP62_07005 [Oligoflexia bacterium]|nr:hypothetical protein [Oligoflexia bacterium]
MLKTPLWAGAPLVWLAPFTVLVQRKITPWTRVAVVSPLVAALGTAALLGGRLEARYLQAAVVAALPFLGAWLRGRRLALALTLTLMLPVSFALVSQVAAVRGRRDP